MLKSVIQKIDINAGGFEPPALALTIRADAKLDAVPEGAVSSIQFRHWCRPNRDSLGSKSRRVFLRPSTSRQAKCTIGVLPVPPTVIFPTLITGRLQPLLLEQALVQPFAQSRCRSVNQRDWPQGDGERPRNVHRAAPSRYFAISARARAVAPRLSSTRRFAVSPIWRFRSGSRNNSIHATPASSGLSTCTAAFAATKREAISAKVFHRRAEDGDFAERRGLQNIMAARFHQGAANEGAVGKLIERSQFADAVEEQHGYVIGDRNCCGRGSAGVCAFPFLGMGSSERRRNLRLDS